MLHGESTSIGSGGAGGISDWVASVTTGSRRGEWQRVDEQLRSLAQQYTSLEAQLARWLREAHRVKVWKYAGCVSMNEYLERVFGFSPRQARDRMLVARRLGDMQLLAAALEQGDLPYSAVRELSRVVMPSTEAAWVEHARGKCLREIEQAVSQREPGDLPDDPPRPDAVPVRVSFELNADTYAQLCQVTKILEDEVGHPLDDDALFAAILDAAVAPPDAEARKGRAKFMIGITACRWCQRAMQHGGGKTVAIDRETFERAQCDSQCIGSLDADAPTPATQDVTPRVRRLIFHRDKYRCSVPGCRSARFLEIHHIVHREHGGTHEPSNLTLVCGGHHQRHHDGLITIEGSAPHQLRIHRGARRDGETGRPLPMGDAAITFATPHVGRATPPLPPPPDAPDASTADD